MFVDAVIMAEIIKTTDTAAAQNIGCNKWITIQNTAGLEQTIFSR